MEKNKVTVTIRNQKYTVVSTETPEDIMLLADAIDEKLKGIMTSSRISLTQALVLTSLDFANEAKAYEKEVTKLKSEMASYLEDAEKAMIERDKYKRELEKIKKQA